MARKWRYLAVILAALGLAVVVWHFKVAALVYYWGSIKLAPEAKGLELAGYRVTIDAKEIQGIAKNASGLTYNSETGTLFSVTNRPPAIFEITTQGELIRVIPLRGASDPEGITHLRANLFLIADEATKKIHLVEIYAGQSELNLLETPQLQLSLDFAHNLGYEGISWDGRSQRLFLTKEKRPMRVLVIEGLLQTLETKDFNLRVTEWKSPRASTLFMTDLSSLTFHEPTGNLVLLSDESKLIVEYSSDGYPVGIMPLWRGWHGLRRSVPQAEGIAFGTDRTLYVVSEPNLFYRFEPLTTAKPN
jgi:uncharacterized protein YjiK